MKDQRPYIHLLILTLLLVLGGYLFFITQNQLKVTNRLQAEVDQLVSQQDKLLSLNVELPSLQPTIATWLASLPSTEDEVAVFAQEVERLAALHGQTVLIDFEDFPAPVDVGGRYIDGLGTDISLEGSFQGLTNFVTDLSRLQYFYKINRLTVTQHETRNGIKATLTGFLMMRPLLRP